MAASGCGVLSWFDGIVLDASGVGMAGPAAPGVGTTRVDWGPVALKTPKTGDLAPLANWVVLGRKI